MCQTTRKEFVLTDSKQRLIDYFTAGLAPPSQPRSVGIEVETQFVDRSGLPISRDQSLEILSTMYRRWQKNDRQFQPSALHPTGHNLQYELGRHNLELSLAPGTAATAVWEARARLAELYEAAAASGCSPFFGPIIETGEDLLAIPDDRDETWLRLDTRPVLNLLASTSAVQFTVEVTLEEAIPMLNRLGAKIGELLHQYPQEVRWRQYIARSPAGYRSDRYGGPLQFTSIEEYSARLLEHHIVDRSTGKLISHEEAGQYEIPLFLRSVWWYFRLKRYNNRLCIEVRPLPRRFDELLDDQLKLVLNIMNDRDLSHGRITRFH